MSWSDLNLTCNLAIANFIQIFYKSYKNGTLNKLIKLLNVHYTYFSVYVSCHYFSYNSESVLGILSG